MQRLNSHRQEPEDQLRQQQPLRGRGRVSRLGAQRVAEQRERQAGHSASRQNATAYHGPAVKPEADDVAARQRDASPITQR